MQKSPANNHSAEGLHVIQHAHEARSEEDGDGDYFPITNCAPTKSATAPSHQKQRLPLPIYCAFSSCSASSPHLCGPLTSKAEEAPARTYSVTYPTMPAVKGCGASA